MKHQQVKCLFSDHPRRSPGTGLGSNSITSDASGTVTAELRYTAYGSSGTSYDFTGQRFEQVLGLHFYNARWYDSSLGRFTSADTLVPNPWNGQAWDRYAYVLNNPVRFNDPFGNSVDCGIGDPYCKAGKLDTKERALDLANSKLNDADQGWVETWAGLDSSDQAILTEGGWNEDVYNSHLFDGNSYAEWYEDPATIILAFVGGYGLYRIGSSVTILVGAESTTSAIQSYYPPNLGFSGSPQYITLQPGSLVSRYGSTYGTFLSPAGTPSWARALPPGTENLPLNTYEVVKPIENVLSGTAASWWGKIGGGIQYNIGTPLGRNVQQLLDFGYLKPR